MKIADFAIPSNLAEARSLLKQLGPQGVPLAGATSLVFMAVLSLHRAVVSVVLHTQLHGPRVRRR